VTGLSRDLLYDEMRRGHLDYIKVGRRRLITRQHLEQFLGITPRLQPLAPGRTSSNRKAATDAS
jgi:excisionase family DNA binding protein